MSEGEKFRMIRRPHAEPDRRTRPMIRHLPASFPAVLPPPDRRQQRFGAVQSLMELEDLAAEYLSHPRHAQAVAETDEEPEVVS